MRGDLSILGNSATRKEERVVENSKLTDEAFIDRLQRAAFGYFLDAANPANGLIADTSRENSPSSIAVVGFALSAYPVAVERGWMARADATLRTRAVLRFFFASDQSGAPNATGWKGFYYHFLDMSSGRRVWQSELSLIDTALLMAGILVARAYFNADDSGEVEVRALADALYRRVDWRWAQPDGNAVSHGWKPECGFLNYGWEGYSEALILYALGLGSPTHPLTVESYADWTRTYQWESLLGQELLYAGPLFIHQFSHAWIDFRGIRDRFMREKRSDYAENSRRATYIQREYAQRNPRGFAGYDENCWGLSAYDGPIEVQRDMPHETQCVFGYAARGVPYGPDDGTLSAPAMLASLPFAPDIVLGTLRNVVARYPEIVSADRLSSSFNPSLTDASGRAWVSTGHYGLDQGIVLMMIENHRTQLLWRLMRGSQYIRRGLRRAGFRGGWLARSSIHGVG